MSITIKMDIRTRKDKTDPKSPYGYWGQKSQMEQLTIEEVLDRMGERDGVGLHEVLTGEKYRPYADLDWTKDITEKNFEQKKYEILKRGKDMMERLFPDADEVHIFCSSGKTPEGKWKVSAHFICTGIYYTNKLHIKHILANELGDPKTWKDQGWDANVYDKDHLFRLPGCTKPGDSRVLRFAECFSVGDVQRIRYGHFVDGQEKEYEFDDGILCSGLITYVEYDEKEMLTPDDYVELKKEYVAVDGEIDLTEAQKATRYENLKKLIGALAPHRANNRQTWTQGLWAIRRLAEQAKQVGSYRVLAHEFSKKTDGGNYSEASTDDIYMEPVKEVGVGYKRLKEWADEDTPGWDRADDFEIEFKKGDEFDIELIKAKAKMVTLPEHVRKFGDAVVGYMNQFFTLIKWGRTPFIISVVYNIDREGQRVRTLDYKSEKALETDFKNKYCFYQIVGEKKPTMFCALDCWISHPKRAEKQRLYFNPRVLEGAKYEDANAYNLFDGLAITYEDCKDAPALTEDSPYLQHLRKRWANGDNAVYNTVLDRFATQVQRPWIKHGVALGLLSPEGAGKSLGLDPLFKIIGAKYIAVPQNAQQVLGNFNALLVGKLLIFLDELTWGGDKEREGALKKLITQVDCTLERKGINAVEMDNLANIVAAINEDWALPASKKGRRSEVLLLSDELCGNQTKEKEEIIRQILNENVFSIAKFLYERDISKFNPRKFHVTYGLRSQKIQSMTPVDAKCLSFLNSGTVKINGIDQLISGATFRKSEFYDSVGSSIRFMTDVSSGHP